MNAFANNLKDNVATAAVIAATLFAILGTAYDAVADTHTNAAQLHPTQVIEAVVVTAPRVDVKLDAIIVTATR